MKIKTDVSDGGNLPGTEETLAVFHRVSGELRRALEQGSLTYGQLREIL